jgi:hypothetical protein
MLILVQSQAMAGGRFSLSEVLLRHEHDVAVAMALLSKKNKNPESVIVRPRCYRPHRRGYLPAQRARNQSFAHT